MRSLRKTSEKFFLFWDKCISRCWNEFSLLGREHLSLTVNGLTNSPKILHITKRNFFKLNCLPSDQWIWSICFCWDFNCVLVFLQCWLSKSPLTPDFLDICLPTFFGVRKFKNTWARSVLFYYKMFKTESKFRKSKKKFWKHFSFLRLLHVKMLQ